MLIRPESHWLVLFYAASNLLMGIDRLCCKTDHFMELFCFGSCILMIFLWLGTFTTLEDGHLRNQFCFIPTANFPVKEITRIEPHKKNGKLGYGTIFIVRTTSGKRLTLSPNKPAPFLALLREQAPQAEFLL